MLLFEKSQPQWEEAYHLMLQLEREPAHAIHVSKLTDQMYEQLQPLHQLDTQERVWLKCAALLHDIGWAISGSRHHIHSMRLILNKEFTSLDKRERLIIANIARYHRKALPKKKHHDYMSLSKEDRLTVKKLAALLRIADGLEKTHSQRVEKLSLVKKSPFCLFSLTGADSCSVECEAVEHKKDLFTQVYGMDFLVSQVEPIPCEMALNKTEVEIVEI